MVFLKIMKKLKLLPAALLLFGSLFAREERPNVLWIYLEDVSGWFSCYGETLIETPNIDQLAKGGFALTVFTHPQVSVLPPVLLLSLG